MNYILTAWDKLRDEFQVWGAEEDAYTYEEIKTLYEHVKENKMFAPFENRYKDFTFSVKCNLNGEII